MADSRARPAPLAKGGLLGSAADLLSDPLNTLLEGYHAYGGIVRFRIGPPGSPEIHGVSGPAALQHILVSNAANYRKDDRLYDAVRHVVGDSLLTNQDELWTRQKKLIHPLFTARQVNGYVPQMSALVARMAARWRRDAPATVDLHAEMNELTLRVLCAVMFGGEAEEIIQVIADDWPTVGEAVAHRAFSAVRLPDAWPTPRARRLAGARRRLFGACDQLIGARRGRPAGSRAPDLLDLLLKATGADGALSDEEVREQLVVFLVGGYDTTATTLAYAFHHLGSRPGLQRRVKQEAERLPRSGTSLDAAALPDLRYTGMVLKETLRLYPAAPVFGRNAVRADTVAGVHVPAGAQLLISPWVLHRDPGLWPDPGVFDPDRFAHGDDEARHSLAWLPFGAGPRLCIGRHFSLAEATVALATLVREFAFTCDATALTAPTVRPVLMPTSPMIATISPHP
ncbi:cytochrome P450 [Nonomuraea sp. PA05]|uniref:cytochrome P450 n=1 Tax=Nonomuraea sp. PA05 TaxID=2604466 RepID=UPI001652298D|nr:cytochrome P450 [Nonomuraea sp. PA05]